MHSVVSALYAEGLSAKDIHERTGYSLGHIRQHIKRCCAEAPSGIKARLPFVSSVTVEPRPDVLLNE